MSSTGYTNNTIAMEWKRRSRKEKTRKVCSQGQKKIKISGMKRGGGKERR